MGNAELQLVYRTASPAPLNSPPDAPLSLSAARCRGAVGIRAGPSPKTVRHQQCLRQLPAVKLGGGRGWQVLDLQWLPHCTRMRWKG